jgi:hypothetical protein
MGGWRIKWPPDAKSSRIFFFLQSKRDIWLCGAALILVAARLCTRRDGFRSPRNVFLVLLNPEAAECCFSCLDLLLADIPSLFSCVRHLNIANTFGSAFNYYLVPAWFAIVTLHLKRQCDLSIHQSIVDFQKKKKKWLFRACSPVWKWTKKVKKWPLNHRTARLGWFNGPVKMTSIEKKNNWVRIII